MNEAQCKFIEITKALKGNEEKDEFYKWIQDYLSDYSLNNGENVSCGAAAAVKSNEKADVLMSCIKTTLKQLVPFEAVFKSEKILFPTIGDDSSLHEKNCMHVDAFLYGEEDVDELIEQGKLMTHYCLDCESTSIEPITFITHSASNDRLKFIFQRALPNLEDKVVLDIGSRLGVVLYAGYVYTKAKELIGVELNKDWCKTQNEIINRFKLQDRVKIVHGDIINNASVVKKSNVIILHNVFEWFMSPKQQEDIWNFLYSTIEPGTIIAAAPPIEISLALLNTSIVVDDWVKERTVEHDHCIEETELKLYDVVKK